MTDNRWEVQGGMMNNPTMAGQESYEKRKADQNKMF
jgi:hypothetical protein